jgi:hypothetical protein
MLSPDSSILDGHASGVFDEVVGQTVRMKYRFSIDMAFLRSE